MKKRLRIIAIILIIMFLPSCWPFGNGNHYDITGVDLHFIQPGSIEKYDYFGDYKPRTDPAEDKMVFLMELKLERNDLAQALGSLSLIENAHAFQVNEYLDNNTVYSTYEISFDTKIKVNGGKVMRGDNLLENELTKNRIYIKKGTRDPSNNLIGDLIIFEERLFDKMEFEKERFTVSFKCKTDDGHIFSAETEALVGVSKLME